MSTSKASRVAAILLVLTATFAVHAPHLDAPFGPYEQNLGCYFGPFAVSWADYGFAPLRGLMVYKTRFQHLYEAVVYQNHPPGCAWATLPFGTDERALRTPFVLAGAASGALLAALLWRRFGAPRAAACGLAWSLSPAVAFDGVAEYAPVVAVVGLAMLLAQRRAWEADRGRGVAVFGVGAAAFVGVWCDWTFVWWLPALTFVSGARRPAALARRLAAPAIGAALALASLFLWRRWASEAPAMGGSRGMGAVDVARSALIDRGFDLGWYFEGVGARLVEGFPWPMLALGAVGIVGWFRTDRGLAAALLLPAVVNALAFAKHAATHVQFVTWFGLTAAAAVGDLSLRLAGNGGRVRRVAAAALPVAAAAASLVMTLAVVRGRATPFFRELGRVADAECADLGPDLALRRLWAIGCNLPFAYAYYVQAPMFAAGVRTPADLEALRTTTRDGVGAKLLVVEMRSDGPWFGAAAVAPTPELKAVLATMPRRDVPELRMTLPYDRYGKQTVRVVDAYVVDVVP
ncbi:MAG TPA: hypothetical protein VEI02_00995 [Planctomycetota bacterium]|nr:hypothetical protein [Planctomycetota bacterium]